MKHNIPQWSYEKHSAVEINSFQLKKLPSCYSNPDSIDAWRHNRMLKPVLTLLKIYPESTWMTVGDGNFGSDAYFLKKNGANVLATSLNDSTLSFAKKQGYIDKFEVENAEKISFPDNFFDFVLCKESYHHFPRPSIAFYEMLRVSKNGIILIEPQESSKKILNYLKDFFKKCIRNDKSTLFEESGNFIYKVNTNEIKKMMIALNFEVIAIKNFNDFYHPKLASYKSSKWSFPFIVTKFGIFLQNLFGILRILDFGGTCIIIFKGVPAEDLLNELKLNNFYIQFLPKNPYLYAV